MQIIGKNVKYASSSNSANAALNPSQLDLGSIGIYTIDAATGLFKLVVKNGSPSTGQVSSTTVKSGYIKIVLGLGNGDFWQSEYHDVLGIQQVLGSIYSAGSGQTLYVGYNPTTGLGDLQFVSSSTLASQNTIGNYHDVYAREAGVKVRQRFRGNNSYGPDIFFNTVVGINDTALTVATNIVAAANAYQEDNVSPLTPAPFTATLTGAYLTAPVQTAAATATTGGTIAASATIYFKIVAISATGYSLASNEVSITVGSGTSTNTATANWGAVTGATSYRVYVGTTSNGQTGYISVNAPTVTATYVGSGLTAGVPPTATNLGIKIVVNDPYTYYASAVYDGIQNADTSHVDPVVPSGDPYQLAGLKGNWIKNEKESNIYRGDLYTMSTVEKKLPSQVDLTKTYNVYDMRSINKTADKTGQKAQTDTAVATLVAFEQVTGKVLDTNQQVNFEQIMTDIFAATSQIYSLNN